MILKGFDFCIITSSTDFRRSHDLIMSLCPPSTEMGIVRRNCTEFGWSEPFPHYIDACMYEERNSSHTVSRPVHLLQHPAFTYSLTGIWGKKKKFTALGWLFVTLMFPTQDMYYVSVKALYTVGYSTSLVSLTMAMVILCRFRWDSFRSDSFSFTTLCFQINEPKEKTVYPTLFLSTFIYTLVGKSQIQILSHIHLS